MLSNQQSQLADLLSGAQAILATDLDGTFLGGTDEERAQLYRYLTEQTHTALVFVTGRDAQHVKYLIDEEGVPRPQFIIGDVGTSVIDGHDFKPVAPVEDWIDQHWGGDDAAQTVLSRHDHLTLQEGYGGRRRSYYISDAAKAAEAKADVEAAGYDAIVSDNRFFDVLPKGVQKGPTLLKFIDVFNVDAAKVVAAGDTLNDLSLFHTGLKSVAVGNREPDLDVQLPGADHVYRAVGNGAAGILEALRHFALYFDLETTP